MTRFLPRIKPIFCARFRIAAVYRPMCNVVLNSQKELRIAAMRLPNPRIDNAPSGERMPESALNSQAARCIKKFDKTKSKICTFIIVVEGQLEG
jgi:hypothetical protein